MILNLVLNWLVLPLLISGVGLAFYRLIQGPTLSSRVIALDMMSVLGIGIIVSYAVLTNQPMLVDVSAVLALISFLGTVAFATYMEMRS